MTHKTPLIMEVIFMTNKMKAIYLLLGALFLLLGFFTGLCFLESIGSGIMALVADIGAIIFAYVDENEED